MDGLGNIGEGGQKKHPYSVFQRSQEVYCTCNREVHFFKGRAETKLVACTSAHVEVHSDCSQTLNSALEQTSCSAVRRRERVGVKHPGLGGAAASVQPSCNDAAGIPTSSPASPFLLLKSAHLYDLSLSLSLSYLALFCPCKEPHVIPHTLFYPKPLHSPLLWALCR